MRLANFWRIERFVEGETMKDATLRKAGVLLVVALAWVVPGCKQERPKRKYVEPIQGIARSIDYQTGEVSMEFVHPKTGLTVVRKGYITRDTEVEINGVVARIQDVKVGEPVTVEGYFEGSGRNKKFIVTRIVVRRDQWIDIPLPEQQAPASQPGR